MNSVCCVVLFTGFRLFLYCKGNSCLFYLLLPLGSYLFLDKCFLSQILDESFTLVWDMIHESFPDVVDFVSCLLNSPGICSFAQYVLPFKDSLLVCDHIFNRVTLWSKIVFRHTHNKTWSIRGIYLIFSTFVVSIAVTGGTRLVFFSGGLVCLDYLLYAGAGIRYYVMRNLESFYNRY